MSQSTSHPDPSQQLLAGLQQRNPVTRQLLVLDASQARLVSVDRTTGRVETIATGLVLAPDVVDPRLGCRAALDVSSDGAQVFFTNITAHNVGVIYTLTKAQQ
ncbi:MAG: hypothetical protein HY000_14780 [Planctomycetes bacterium]|nr:hypothetical protein [Planctomycetota bacterium]